MEKTTISRVTVEATIESFQDLWNVRYRYSPMML
jgi:hypothetical protein